ncbi:MULTISPECIES: LysR family transcriptional regulator [Mesorhizobium]|uniref:LysR family transcriptional regulator n=1 Tax=Rhizobium loti TaxID=381 RepID=A0A6M7U9E3_RHILI|nr:MULTISPECIES: LysR family transcriptional regulator [Mesorhizobium]KRB26275.1 LysR family transcriptional regulator [Mesorhizobium sp. Root172]OBQ64539.1 LysR family transcriptional regulator [Mesorhizobium loti]QKC73442.1 LysR family transcriptional regulator [Mesorhizobium loti]
MDVAAALRAFLRTVERGSITGAARDLAISQPAVSKLVSNLEKHLQARLLERSARHVRPTPEGRALYDASRTPLAQIDAALEGVRSDAGVIEGGIRVHTPSCIGVKNLHPIVMEFQRRHPKVTVELVLENRVVDLVYENFDLAIRYGRPEAQEVIVRRIGQVRRILVASPSFLRRVGPIDTLDQLAVADLVVTPAVLSSRNMLALIKGFEQTEVAVHSILRTNDASVIANTVLSGHAAGPVQLLLVSEDLKAGRLVRILPDYEVRPSELFIAYPSIRFMRPAVRALSDHIISRLTQVDGVDTTGVAPAEKALGPSIALLDALQ